MSSGRLVFGRFALDPHDRRLTRDDEPVELNSRYLDALVLLVHERGRLVTKDRFLDEVWNGTPVTDEAITQCIRTLRKQLGDDASNPRFIETVPKHGYRFIAAVEESGAAASRSPHAANHPVGSARGLGWLATAGTLGGAAAGLVGGLLYGFAAAAEAGTGVISAVLVVLAITLLIALIGGAGVGLGIAAGRRAFGTAAWASVAGGAAGGLVTGAVVKLLGIDAFNLLFGASPGDITGAAEGALLGGAVGLAAWLAIRDGGAFATRRAIAAAGAIGAAAGIVIVLLGGRLMVGSLDLLVRQFSGSRLRLDQIGHIFGERGLGDVSQLVIGGLEGALFAACIVAAIRVLRDGAEPKNP